MADRKPLKVLPDGGGDSTGLGEFVEADTIGVVDGGTGLNAVGANRILTGHDSDDEGALTAEANLTFDGSTLLVGTSIAATADTNTSIGLPGSDVLTLNTGGSEAMRITSAQAVGIGGTPNSNVNYTPNVQILGTSVTDANLLIGRYSNDNGGGQLTFLKTRSTSIGTTGGVAGNGVDDNDQLGQITWYADDQTDSIHPAAQIRAQASATASNNNLPAELIFATTPASSTGPTDRMVIDSTGAITKPSHPAFLTRYTGFHSNATGAGTTVTLNGSEVFDRGGNHADGNFTAPVSGTYFFQSNIYLEGLTSSMTGLYHHFQTSDDNYSTTEVSAMGMVVNPWAMRNSNGAFSVTNSWVVDMAANDTAKCTVQVSGGSSNDVDIVGSIATLNTFSGFLIG
tara:strand:- start:6799 stop:7992 length:1194 start_codon:yes stop_codon:yes gene_type:complete